MKTPVTPNLGTPTSTPDMRGGLELQGVINLNNFVKAGGTFITLAESSSLPIHFGLAQGVSIRQTENLWAPGGVFRVTLADRASPIAYGYGDDLGVYFDGGPVFAAGGGGGGRGGRGGGGGGGGAFAGGGAGRGAANDGSTTGRRSSRGGVDEQDVAQGRARDLGRAGVEEYRREQQGQTDQPAFGGGDPTGPRTRVVFRFSPEVQRLLISGGLTNGNELTSAPAVVDAPLGDGHVVLFSFNPFWRGGTLGSYALVFNALLHHRSLSAGEAVADR
jgi:hypothetical protein